MILLIRVIVIIIDFLYECYLKKLKRKIKIFLFDLIKISNSVTNLFEFKKFKNNKKQFKNF